MGEDHRVVIFLATIPVTILMNSFRVGMIGVLVNHFGIEHAEGFIHYFEGWVIFISCTVILYVLAWLLSRYFSFGRERPKYIIGMDYEGVLGPLKKFPSVVAGKAFVAASVIALVAGIAWQMTPASTPASIDRLPLGIFPMHVENWQGRATILERDIERVLGADEYLLADYKQDDANVNLLMTFYKSQTKGSGIHSPEICLPGGGWEVSKWEQKTITVGEAGNDKIINVNRAVIQLGLQRQLVYFWFEQRGRRITNDFEAKFVSMWDTFSEGRSDGGLVRVVTPIAPGEDVERADDRLQTFLDGVVPMLPQYFPAIET